MGIKLYLSSSEVKQCTVWLAEHMQLLQVHIPDSLVNPFKSFCNLLICCNKTRTSFWRNCSAWIFCSNSRMLASIVSSVCSMDSCTSFRAVSFLLVSAFLKEQTVALWVQKNYYSGLLTYVSILWEMAYLHEELTAIFITWKATKTNSKLLCELPLVCYINWTK